MTAVPLADEATRLRRSSRLALVLLHRGAIRLVPGRPRRTDVRTAAGTLTALGVRIDVRPPAVAWPRPGTGRLVVANRVCRLDDLALRTVVPDRVVQPVNGGRPGRFQPFDPEAFRSTAENGAPVCPIAVRYRTDDGTDPTALLGTDDLATTVRRALAVRRLVIEVHLLSPLPPCGDDPRTLAVLAEDAIAGRLEEPPDRAYGSAALAGR